MLLIGGASLKCIVNVWSADWEYGNDCSAMQRVFKAARLLIEFWLYS